MTPYIGQPVWLRRDLDATVGIIAKGSLGAVVLLDPLRVLFKTGHNDLVNHVEEMSSADLLDVEPLAEMVKAGFSRSRGIVTP